MILFRSVHPLQILFKVYLITCIPTFCFFIKDSNLLHKAIHTVSLKESLLLNHSFCNGKFSGKKTLSKVTNAAYLKTFCRIWSHYKDWTLKYKDKKYSTYSTYIQCELQTFCNPLYCNGSWSRIWWSFFFCITAMNGRQRKIQVQTIH